MAKLLELQKYHSKCCQKLPILLPILTKSSQMFLKSQSDVTQKLQNLATSRQKSKNNIPEATKS